MIIFGGGETASSDRLYIFDTESMYCQKIDSSGIPLAAAPRGHSCCVLDNKMYIYGGGDGSVYYDHLYVLDTNTLQWTKQDCTGTPPGPRRSHTATLVGKRMYVFGGGDGNKALNDIFVLDTDRNSWEKITVKSSEVPASRGYHTASLIENKLCIYGGSDGQECFSDLWSLDLNNSTWTQFPLKSALPCFSHSACMIGSYLCVIGGHNGSVYESAVRMLRIPGTPSSVQAEWYSPQITGEMPSPRGYSTALLYDNSKIFLVGGYDGKRCYHDVNALELNLYTLYNIPKRPK